MRGVPRRGTTMPIREEKLVPDLEEGDDTSALAVNRKILNVIARAKGIILHLSKSNDPGANTLDERAAGWVSELLEKVIKLVAAEKHAREEMEQSRRSTQDTDAASDPPEEPEPTTEQEKVEVHALLQTL